jgi:hypothetical protein
MKAIFFVRREKTLTRHFKFVKPRMFYYNSATGCLDDAVIHRE